MVNDPSSSTQRLDEWKTAVENLVRRIEQWAAEQGWPAARQEKTCSERGMGAYTVPDVTVKSPG